MKNVTFEHVKGIDEAKSELQDVVEFLRNPQKFTVLGGKLPKGEVSSIIHKVMLVVHRIEIMEDGFS